MVLYFRVKNRVMNKKLKNYSIHIVKIDLHYYRVENKVPFEHFYFKLFFIGENRVGLEMPKDGDKTVSGIPVVARRVFILSDNAHQDGIISIRCPLEVYFSPLSKLVGLVCNPS